MQDKRIQILLPYVINFFQIILIMQYFIINTSNIVLLNNLLLFAPAAALLILLPIGWNAVYIIDAVILYGVNYLNAFLISARGRPLHYIDFFCLRDGLNVVSRYRLIFDFRQALNLFVVFSVTFLAYYLLKKRRQKNLSAVQ